VNSFPFIIIGATVAVCVLLLLNFQFLLYPIHATLNPMKHASRLTLTGSTLFISDLHLKAGRPFPYSLGLREVLETRNVSNLVIVGDLFDTPEDAGNIVANTSQPVAKILGFDGLTLKAFFVYGSPSHDPSPKDEAIFAHTSITPLGTCAILDFGNIVVVAYHGHHLSTKGAFGHAWDRFVAPLSLERTWRGMAGVPESDWAIFGHTHIPGIDPKHRVANCGGWQSKGFLVRPACTGLILSRNGNVLEVVHFARQ
jgi:UDP-2,3-diacylglucosamine pyrophosphatase LpxH